MAKIFGLDGGGTKTEVLIWDTNQGEILSFRLGTSNINQLGPTKFENLFMEISNKLGQENIQLDVAILGIPGFGESEKSDKIIQTIISKYIVCKNTMIYNDVEVGHFGALKCEDGINIVSGTGSIGLGIYQGKKIRCGGWGEVIGDEGSSYKIGLQTLQTISKQIDKRLEHTILFEIIQKNINIGTMNELISFVYHSENSRTKIAAISQYTYQAALQGCELSQEILRVAAKELVLHVDTIIKQLQPLDRKIPVSYSGGTFNAKEFFLEEFLTGISQHECVEFIKPQYTPVEGAILKGYQVLDTEL